MCTAENAVLQDQQSVVMCAGDSAKCHCHLNHHHHHHCPLAQNNTSTGLLLDVTMVDTKRSRCVLQISPQNLPAGFPEMPHTTEGPSGLYLEGSRIASRLLRRLFLLNSLVCPAKFIKSTKSRHDNFVIKHVEFFSHYHLDIRRDVDSATCSVVKYTYSRTYDRGSNP